MRVERGRLFVSQEEYAEIDRTIRKTEATDENTYRPPHWNDPKTPATAELVREFLPALTDEDAEKVARMLNASQTSSAAYRLW